jgi:hypothetical protein
MPKNELEVLLEETMNEVGKNLTHLKSANKNVGKMLENNYYKRENNEYCNTNFEDIEVIEYNLDVFFEKYKLIKQKIAKARLVKYKLTESTSNQEIPEELARIGCKRIMNNQ